LDVELETGGDGERKQVSEPVRQRQRGVRAAEAEAEAAGVLFYKGALT
jgi:hypothetical protein